MSLALGQLVHHRLRSALTLLGMVFGVGAVIAMLAVSEGGKRQALVSCHELNVGYRRSSLMRASFAVNCQLTVASN